MCLGTSVVGHFAAVIIPIVSGYFTAHVPASSFVCRDQRLRDSRGREGSPWLSGRPYLRGSLLTHGSSSPKFRVKEHCRG